MLSCILHENVNKGRPHETKDKLHLTLFKSDFRWKKWAPLGRPNLHNTEFFENKGGPINSNKGRDWGNDNIKVHLYQPNIGRPSYICDKSAPLDLHHTGLIVLSNPGKI